MSGEPSVDPTPPPPPPKPTIHQESPEQYLEELEKEDKEFLKLQAEAKEIFAKKGPLCDSEGFYQHSGECWSDATQQIMNNGDTLKEKVQQKMIEMTFTKDLEIPDKILRIRHERFTTLLKEVFTEQKELKALRAKQKQWILLYLREAQKRFLRHYILESKRRNLKEELCKTQLPAILAKDRIQQLSKQIAYRGQGKEARLTAIFGMLKKLSVDAASRPALEDYIANESLAGGTDYDIETLLSVYNHVFFDNKLEYSYLKTDEVDSAFRFIANDEAFNEYITSISGIIFAIRIIRPGKTQSSGHEMGFFVCGDKYFFYEDNHGILEYDWKVLFKKYYDLLKEKAEQDKITNEYNRLKQEKEEAEKDPAKKKTFEKTKGPFFTNAQDKYSKLTPETLLDNINLGCLKFKKTGMDPTVMTNYYPCVYAKRGGEYKTYTVVKDTLKEVPLYESLIFKEGEDEITLTINIQEMMSMYETFFFLYKLGTEKANIKNVGFELNTSARLERKYILLDLIDRREDDVLKTLDEEKFLSPTVLADAVFLAIHLNTTKILDKLLEKKVQVYRQTVDGYSPVTLAINENKPEIVKLLLEKDEKVKESRFKEYTLPYFSLIADVVHNSTVYIQLLLDSGFDINSQFNIDYYPFKYTLLYLAYVVRNIQLITFLCSKGADVNILPSAAYSKTAKTLLDLAKEQGASQEILNALEACKPPPAEGGRFRKTRKHKIEKTHRTSRKARQ